MNESSSRFAPPDFATLPPARAGTGRRVLLLTIGFFVAQLAFFFVFGTKKQTVARPVGRVPQLTLTDIGNELVALDNPTLFALPNIHDFSARVWTQLPSNPPPDFRWQEPPRWLQLNPADLASGLNILQPDAVTETPLDFKVAPAPEFAPAPTKTFFPASSALSINGPLAGRKLLSPILIPVLKANDILSPTRVQLLVGPEGGVVSSVILDSSGQADADQAALKLAQTANFAPAKEFMFGEMTFQWHTEPASDLNVPQTK